MLTGEATGVLGQGVLGILEYGKVKKNEMETEFVRECKRKMKLILKSKLNAKNKIEAINP